MTKEKISDKIIDKDKLKKWIYDNCIENVKLRWSDIPKQSFVKIEDGNLLVLVCNKKFLNLYKTVSDLDEVIFLMYQNYCTRDIITLACPSNPGYKWAKKDTMSFRQKIYDFFVLYVLKLEDAQITNQLSFFLEKYTKLYNVDKLYQHYVKENKHKKRDYLLYLIVVLFLFENEENVYNKERYRKKAAEFLEMVKHDFFNIGQQIYEETFGMEFDDDVRINLLKAACEKKHIESSYELAEFYKFSIKMGNTTYTWNDVFSIYSEIENIDESGRASWALGKITEKGHNSGKVDYVGAKRYYENAIKCGYSKAYNSLANLYRENKIDYNDVIKGIGDVIDLYKTAIEKGNIYAYINLGHVYSTERYNCRNLYEAEQNYRKAEERNSELATYFRAKLYFDNREVFNNIDDSCLANMYIKMTGYSSQFKYLGKVYEYLARLLKANGLLDAEIRSGLNIPVNNGNLIDKLNKLAWDNGNREVIYDLAISAYNNEEDTYLRSERVSYYLDYRNAMGISDDVREKCETLYNKLKKS